VAFEAVDSYAQQHPDRVVRDEIEIVQPTHRRIEHAVLPIHEDGTLIGQLEVFRDITVETETSRAQEDFLSLVSHEFRTPLTAVIGNATYLLHLLAQRDSVKASDITPRLQQTLTAAHRTEDMVDQLLDVISIDMGRLVLHRRPVSLGKLLHTLLARLRPLTAGHNVSADVAPVLPLVYADPRRVEQVITNLVSNAVKFSAPETPIEVSLKTEGGAVVLSVKDHGEGMSATDVERLFDRFYRVRRRYPTREGLGLGLYISKEIIEMHGGSIEVESMPGVGSTFTITLPVYRPPSSPTESQESTPGATTT